MVHKGDQSGGSRYDPRQYFLFYVPGDCSHEQRRYTVPDLLISDVEMPDMRGPVLLHEIKRISPGIQCILMSGHVKDPVNFPVDVRFLPKPFRASELFSAIGEVLPLVGA